MHPVAKVIIGIILILIGLGLFADEITPLIHQYQGVPAVPWLSNFVTVLTGVIPIFLIIVGLFIVWLEADEVKADKELKKKKKR